MTSSRSAVFVDTGAWIALYKKADPHHTAVAAAWEALRSEGAALVTSSDVLDETYTRLCYDVGHRWALSFHRFIEEAKTGDELVVQWVTEAIFQDAWSLFEQYDDQTLSLTDCTSAAICHRLHIRTILTLDRDFLILGFETLPTGGRT